MINSRRSNGSEDNENADEVGNAAENSEKEQKMEEEDEELQKERDAEVKKLTMSFEDRAKEFRNLLLEKSVRTHCIHSYTPCLDSHGQSRSLVTLGYWFTGHSNPLPDNDHLSRSSFSFPLTFVALSQIPTTVTGARSFRSVMIL